MHANNFWLGLRLNRTQLSGWRDEETGLSKGCSGEVAALDAHTSEGRRREEEREAEGVEGGQSRRAARILKRRAVRHEAIIEAAKNDAPVPLFKHMERRLVDLGLTAPRDARDAVAPLWELPLQEQQARKTAELRDAVARLIEIGGGQGECGGSPSTPASSSAAASAAAASSAASASSAAAPAPTALADIFRPMRAMPPAAAVRNKIQLHVGLDVNGEPCCGFRCGRAAQTLTVATPEGVPFVAPWMAAAAAAMSRWMRSGGATREAESAVVGVAAVERWSGLMLRGSVSLGEGVAVLSAMPSDQPLAEEPAANLRSLQELAASLRAAAAAEGVRLLSVALGGAVHVPLPADGATTGAPSPATLRELLEAGTSGVYFEHFKDGLRLRISPIAFFQARSPRPS